MASLQSYPDLETELKQQCMAILERHSAPTEELCANLLEMEYARINVHHPGFVANEQLVGDDDSPESKEFKRARFERRMEQLAQNPELWCVESDEQRVLCEVHAWKVKHVGNRRQWCHVTLLRVGVLVWFEGDKAGALGETALGGCSLAGSMVTRTHEKRLCLSTSHKEYYFEFTTKLAAAEWERQLKEASRGRASGSAASSFERSWVFHRAPVISHSIREELMQLPWQKRKTFFQISYMLRSYMDIVQEQLSDIVPKAIVARLISPTRKEIDVELGFINCYEAVERFMGQSANMTAEIDRWQKEFEAMSLYQSILLKLGSCVRDGVAYPAESRIAVGG